MGREGLTDAVVSESSGKSALGKTGAAGEEIASVAAAKAILAGWLHARRASRSRCEACYLRGLNRASGRDIVHQRPPKRLRGAV